VDRIYVQREVAGQFAQRQIVVLVATMIEMTEQVE